MIDKQRDQTIEQRKTCKAGTPTRTEPIQKQSEEGDRVKGVIVVAWEKEEEKGTISLL